MFAQKERKTAMNQNNEIIAGIKELITSKGLLDQKPTDVQCQGCIKTASQRVSQSGGAIQHCDFHGVHIGSRYGELRPRLVLVGLENPEANSRPTLERAVCTDTELEKAKTHFKGSLHRNGEFAFIQRMFPSAEVPFAHVATLNRRLHGLRSGRHSASKELPGCPHVSEILRLLRPQIIVMEERRGKWQPEGNGWGTWIPHTVSFSAKMGKKCQSAAILTTTLDGNKVALVLANHPSSLGSRWNALAKGNYRETILVPAALEAVRTLEESAPGKVKFVF